MSAVEDFRAALIEALPARTSEARIEVVVTLFEQHANLAEVRAVLPTAARGPVGSVEAYGLLIDLDANGRAARVALASTELGNGATTDGFDVEHWD